MPPALCVSRSFEESIRIGQENEFRYKRYTTTRQGRMPNTIVTQTQHAIDSQKPHQLVNRRRQAIMQSG
jgi:hypothetical protein